VFKDPFATRQLDRDEFLRTKLNEIFWAPRGLTLDTSERGPNVEEILTMLRDSERQTYGLAKLLGDELPRFRRALYVLIKTAVYDGKSSQGRHLNPLIQFARANFSSMTWATFNWDCVFESSFYYSSGTDGWTRSNPEIVIPLGNWRNTRGRHRLLKLHGGINWWFENNAVTYLPFGYATDLHQRWNEYARDAAPGHPVILEPSAYKYQDPIYEILKPQWNSFVQSLVEADCVIVIGYSLPSMDQDARTAITLAFQQNTAAKWLIINHNAAVCDHYTRLLGSRRVTCLPISLQEFNADIETILRREFPQLGPAVPIAAVADPPPAQ
jgi:hypothetical protein